MKSGKQIALMFLFFSELVTHHSCCLLFGNLKYMFSEHLTVEEHPEVQIDDVVNTASMF